MCCKNNFVAKRFGHLSATHCLCSNVWCSRCSLTHAATYHVRAVLRATLLHRAIRLLYIAPATVFTRTVFTCMCVWKLWLKHVHTL